MQQKVIPFNVTEVDIIHDYKNTSLIFNLASVPLKARQVFQTTHTRQGKRQTFSLITISTFTAHKLAPVVGAFKGRLVKLQALIKKRANKNGGASFDEDELQLLLKRVRCNLMGVPGDKTKTITKGIKRRNYNVLNSALNIPCHSLFSSGAQCMCNEYCCRSQHFPHPVSTVFSFHD